MDKEIYSKQVPIEDLMLGDNVFEYLYGKTSMVGVVVKVGETFLHKHRYVVIKYSWISVAGEKYVETKKHFFHDCDTLFNVIRWRDKEAQKKPKKK